MDVGEVTLNERIGHVLVEERESGGRLQLGWAVSYGGDGIAASGSVYRA